MSELANGALVHHSTLGLGKVVAVESNAVHVFFPGSERRYAAKLRWPLANPLLRTEGLERDSWLEGLSSFSLDPGTGRYALGENWLTHDQAVAEFLGRCSGGFAEAEPDAGTRRTRASRWRAARAEWIELLGSGRGEALLADGDVAGLTSRTLRIERLLAPIAGLLDDGALREALAEPRAAGLFFEALFGLLSAPVPGRARFDKLFAAAIGLEAAPGSAWSVATLFPFLADPGRHMVLRPKSARAAAERLGCDLQYDAAPNWTTYTALRAFAGGLLERLKPMGARDFIDVETFLYVIGTARTQVARSGELDERPPRPAAAPGARRARSGPRAPPRHRETT
jgi:hypothetical protein